MVLFKHKNKGKNTVRILDSNWNTYYLKPGDEVIIDKDSTRDGVVVIEELLKRPVKRIIRPKKKVKIEDEEEEKELMEDD